MLMFVLCICVQWKPKDPKDLECPGSSNMTGEDTLRLLRLSLGNLAAKWYPFEPALWSHAPIASKPVRWVAKGPVAPSRSVRGVDNAVLLKLGHEIDILVSNDTPVTILSSFSRVSGL